MADGWFAKAVRSPRGFRVDQRRRGDEARDRGDWTGAIDAYQKHLAANPDDRAIWIQLGHASKEDGEYDAALTAYLKADAQEPDDADLHLNVGHLYKVMGQLDSALVSYRRCAAIDPAVAGGDALVQLELIRSRFAWLAADGEPPRDLDALAAAVDAREARAGHLFADYFQSFTLR